MIGFWFVLVVLMIILLACVWTIVYYGFGEEKKSQISIVGSILSLIVIGGVIFGGVWWINNTAHGARMQLTWEAEMNVGLQRNVQVFTATGELVYEYQGRFDVDQNDNRIIIDIFNEDNQPRRVYISAPAGVVIISQILD